MAAAPLRLQPLPGDRDEILREWGWIGKIPKLDPTPAERPLAINLRTGEDSSVLIKVRRAAAAE